MIVTYCFHLQGDATTIQIENPSEGTLSLENIQEACLRHFYKNSRSYTTDVSSADVILLLIKE